MALVMTIMTVVAMLGGITVLLWLSTWVESRHLGPAVASGVDVVGVDVTDGVTEPAPALTMVEGFQAA